MKSLFVILFILAPLSFANARGSISDRNALEDSAFQKANNLQRALNRNILDMTDDEIVKANQHMTKALQVIQGQAIGGGQSFIANVRIEDTSMTIEANSIEDFIGKCEIKAKSLKISMVDSIGANISGGTPKFYNKQLGFFNEVSDQCSTAAKLVVDSADSENVSVTHAKYLLSGMVEDVGLIALGDSISELEQSCLDHIKRTPSMVDSISVKMNGGTPKNANKQLGFWNSKQEICSQAISLVF